MEFQFPNLDDDDFVKRNGCSFLPKSVGNLIWVKEAWQAECDMDHLKPSDIPAGSNIIHNADREHFPWLSRKRLAMHMPQWASRLTLRVTSVRVERLQDISEADADAEGVAPVLVPPDGGSCPCKEGFRVLWDRINGKKPGQSWADNPWCTAYSFEVIKANVENVK